VPNAPLLTGLCRGNLAGQLFHPPTPNPGSYIFVNDRAGLQDPAMKTLLLVDDSRAVRLAGAKMAAALGFQTLEAEDGQAALEQMRQHPEIDAVLLDWNMPVLDGLSFLKTLRAETSLPQPVVIMCTTENEMQRIVEAMQSGANEYIMKPFTEDIVREKFEEVGVL
jgi:two-component system chemotaxis response regulator CheY